MSRYDVEQVRGMFPALVSNDDQQPPIFLDNPAGTQLPRTVIEAVGQAMASASSNLGGVFPASVRADEIWQSSHESMVDMMGASSMREIVVGPSMTTLTLHISRSIGRTLNRGDEIIVTRMDHEGDISPWLLLAEDLGLVVKWLPFNRDSWRIEVEDLDELLTDRTRLLALIELCQQPYRQYQQRSRTGGGCSRSGRSGLCRCGSTGAAPPAVCKRAELRFPGLLVL